jgi:hypothetical protein
MNPSDIMPNPGNYSLFPYISGPAFRWLNQVPTSKRSEGSIIVQSSFECATTCQ